MEWPIFARINGPKCVKTLAGNIANEQYHRKLMFSDFELNPGHVFPL
jgi:hypothetical protein